PFGLLEEAGLAGPPVVAAYAPVFRGGGDPGSADLRLSALSGFALAIFRVAPLVDVAASEVDASGLGMLLRDAEAPAAALLAERPPKASRLPRRSGFDLVFPVAFASRRWELEAFPLPGAYL